MVSAERQIYKLRNLKMPGNEVKRVYSLRYYALKGQAMQAQWQITEYPVKFSRR